MSAAAVRAALPALSLAVLLAAIFWLQPRAMSYLGLNLLLNLAVPIALATLALTTRKAKTPVRRPALPLLIVALTGAALVYGTLDMPHFGDPEAPASNYPHPSYVERTEHDIHVPNVVTAVLASYRGYDTLGETVVIFTAGIAVLVLLRGSRKRRPPGGGGERAG